VQFWGNPIACHRRKQACSYPFRNGNFLVYSSSTSLGLDYINLGISSSVAAYYGLWFISTVNANNIRLETLYIFSSLVAGHQHLLVLPDNFLFATSFRFQYLFSIYIHFIFAQLQASSLLLSFSVMMLIMLDYVMS
jgi:hypothetical protein